MVCSRLTLTAWRTGARGSFVWRPTDERSNQSSLSRASRLTRCRLGRRFGFIVPMVFALLTATSLTACNGDSGDGGGPAPDASRTTEPTPLAGAGLIAFEQLVPGAEERDLYAVRADGGEPRLLRSPGDYPHWSPDGSQLAFLACLNPPDCTTAVALMERSTGDVHGFSMPDPDLYTPCPVWTPSGTELACGALSESDPTRNGVYTIRAADGKGLTRITKNPGGEDLPLAYSPDGSQLLLSRMDPSRADSVNQALFIAPVSGGWPTRSPVGDTRQHRGLVSGRPHHRLRHERLSVPREPRWAGARRDHRGDARRVGCGDRLRCGLRAGRRKHRLLAGKPSAGHLQGPPRRHRRRTSHHRGRPSRELGCHAGTLTAHDRIARRSAPSGRGTCGGGAEVGATAHRHERISRLLVPLTSGPGLASLGPGARPVALIAVAHADPSGSRVALSWHAWAGRRRVGKRLKRGLPSCK